MNVHFVTFATSTKFGTENYYSESIRNLIDSAKLFGVEHFHLYTPSRLPVAKHVKDYMESTKDPGYGYYSWKPIVIMDVMHKINNGDVVLYHDAGRPVYRYAFRKDINILIDNVIQTHKGIGVPTSLHEHRQWCKRDCFINMNCNEPRYWNLKQVCATWSIWEKNNLALEFLKEWKYYCTDERGTVTTHDSLHGKLSDFSDFNEHRWDQAILTNLVEKYSDSGVQPLSNTGGWEKDINGFIL